MSDLRVLGPGDEAAFDAFLARHADSSMFLRSNARAAGLTDRGAPSQGTYVAALEHGEIVGIAVAADRTRAQVRGRPRWR